MCHKIRATQERHFCTFSYGASPPDHVIIQLTLEIVMHRKVHLGVSANVEHLFFSPHFYRF